MGVGADIVVGRPDPTGGALGTDRRGFDRGRAGSLAIVVGRRAGRPELAPVPRVPGGPERVPIPSAAVHRLEAHVLDLLGNFVDGAFGFQSDFWVDRPGWFVLRVDRSAEPSLAKVPCSGFSVTHVRNHPKLAR